MDNQKLAKLIGFLEEGKSNAEIRFALNISDTTIRYWHAKLLKEGYRFPDRPVGRPALKLPKP